MSSDIKEGDKLYVITRRDISPGYQGVQSIHAMRQFTAEHPEIDRAWFVKSNYLAWLSVADEAELYELVSKALEHDIRHAIFREPDVQNEITAIALEPGKPSASLCSGLPLALKELT